MSLPDGRVDTVERDGQLGEYVIGRLTIGQTADAAHMAIDDRFVSRRHCSLVWDGTAQWLLQDLGSTNGTMLNDKPARDEIALESGLEIKVGGSAIRFEFGSPSDRPWNKPDLGRAAAATPQTVTSLPSTVEGDDATIATIAPIAEPKAGSAAPDDATVVSIAVADPTVAGSPPSSEAADATVVSRSAFPAEPASPDRSTLTDAGVGLQGRGLLDDLRRDGLLSEEIAASIARRAREYGDTVFSIIAGDHSLANQQEIYDWAAQRTDCRSVDDAAELQDAVRTVDWLSLRLAEQRGILLLEGGGANGLEYATIDPFDVLKRDWVARCEGRETARPVLVSPLVFRSVLSRLRAVEGEGDEGEIGVAIDIDWSEAEQLRENLEGQDVPMIVDYVLFRAHGQGSSDIHVEPTEEALLIRNRVDGMLHEEAMLPKALHPEISSRIKILAGMDVAEKRRPQDGRISIHIKESPIDVRVSTFPTVHGEKIVMRLLDKSSLMPSPEHLGLRPRELRVLTDKISAPFGLIMLCGPTGSGKTTTLYSCLGAIDKTVKNVLTVEDPVEYRLAGVHQMQVNHKIGLTFAEGLRNILRQDPDVIMVGECRDLETTSMAIQASLTGHIVFSTIHTNDSIGVVSRLLDMNIDPFLVASSLSLAIAQRLVRTICPHCKTQVDGRRIVDRLRAEGVSDEKMAMLGIVIEADLPYVIGGGCRRCRDTGYAGRQAVFEVFEMTNACKQIVVGDAFNVDELRRVAEENGLATLVSNGLKMVEEGVTTHEEVIRVLGESG
ncbi:MAG: ATPase, T2SS/T4P/T4SS family [Alphaproteobacteria bacterium]|nr:ATPase, T2SS/T4P/T4SS family [Alphaproteobacteria bacterium]